VRRRSLSLVIALLASSLLAAPARADDDDGKDGNDGKLLRGARLGIVPTLGVGVAGFTGQRSYYPSFVGTSVSQLDFIVDTGRWGLFVRGAYLSSGGGGLWTAPVAAAGPTYRFAGDGEERWGIVGRAGLLYQRWRAVPGGCSPPLFIPSGCPEYVAPPSGTSFGTTAPANSTIVDNLGLLAGVAFEVPVEAFYFALGAEVSSTVDVDHASPGLVFASQLTLAFALRDHVHDSRVDRRPRMRHQVY
jgi:hypothetical protein